MMVCPNPRPSHAQAVALCVLASAGSVLHAGAVHVLPAAGRGPRAFLAMCASALVPLIITALVPEAD